MGRISFSLELRRPKHTIRLMWCCGCFCWIMFLKSLIINPFHPIDCDTAIISGGVSKWSKSVGPIIRLVLIQKVIYFTEEFYGRNKIFFFVYFYSFLLIILKCHSIEASSSATINIIFFSINTLINTVDEKVTVAMQQNSKMSGNKLRKKKQ